MIKQFFLTCYFALFVFQAFSFYLRIYLPVFLFQPFSHARVRLSETTRNQEKGARKESRGEIFSTFQPVPSDTTGAYARAVSGNKENRNVFLVGLFGEKLMFVGRWSSFIADQFVCRDGIVSHWTIK